jgi:glycosyltransferase involved in cell wall biosynthesis
VVYADYFVDSRVIREAGMLVDMGCSVDVICLRSKKGAAPSRSNGVNVLPLGMKRYRGASKARFFLSYLKFFLLAFLRLSRLHISKRYNIVQAHNIPDFLVFTALIPKISGARIILDVRDPMPEGFMVKYGISERNPITRLTMLQETMSMRFADEVICVSEQHKRLYMAHGVPDSKFTILLNLPDKRTFSNIMPGKKTRGSFELVFHGTLAERLGIDVAIRAVDIVRDEVSEVIFKIYGGGEFLPELEKLVDELDVRNHVYLSGKFHPFKEIPDLIKTAHAGIVPNQKNIITDLMMPVKLIEYISLGIPVIATRLATIDYYFGDFVSLFDPGDYHDLASCLLEFYYKPDKAERLAEEARSFLDRYNWESEEERYSGLIDKLVPGRC